MKEGWEYKKLEEICSKGSSNISLNRIEDNIGEYNLYGASGLVKGIDFYHQEKSYIGIVKDGSGVGRVDIYPPKSSLVGTMQYIFPKEGCEIGFLKYLLQGLHLESYKTGAAIPHIYFKDYGKSKVPFPPISEQQHIVEELDLLSSIIEKKKAQLNELDILALSLFYEMFGDPITNEKGWNSLSLDKLTLSMVRGPFGSALKKEFFVSKSEDAYKVYEQKHAIQKDATIGEYYISKEKFEELRRFEVSSGDIIMSCSGTIGEFYEIPKGAEKGVMNQALLKFTIDESLISKSYFLFVMQFVKNNFTVHGSGLQNIGSVKVIKAIKISVPSIDLQQEFASKIDAIEHQKELIKQSIKEVETLFNSRMDFYFN